MEKTKKKMKLWKKLTIIAMSVILVLCLALGGFVLFLRVPVKAYYSASTKAFEIPGLKSGFVPQGFDFDETSDCFLVSGYMKNGSPSPLYLVDRVSGKTVNRVTFLTDENENYIGHFGGVAIYNDFVYVTHEKALLVYSYSQIKNASDSTPISCLGKVPLKYSNTDYIKASFVTVYGNTLYVGEFYDGEKYTTLKSHHFTTNAGDKNCAIAITFDLDNKWHLGIDTTPREAYSLPNKVQGFCIYGSKIYLSTSYGLTFSHILEHDKNKRSKVGGTEQNYVFLGTAIPVYALDSSSLVYDYKLPPMSEEIVMIDNYLYVMNESASTKYFFGKLTGGKWCYKTDLEKMKV